MRAGTLATDVAADGAGMKITVSVTEEPDHRQRKRVTDMTTATYTVTGMTCGHCVNAVTTELSAIAGVTDVDVDLDTGRATVTSEEPLDLEVVAAAVDEAGYELTS